MDSRVRALHRILAPTYAQVVLQFMSEDLCLEWHCAAVEGQPLPDSHAFVRKVVTAGFHLPSFLAVMNYLDRCRSENREPDPLELSRRILPWPSRD